MIYFSKILVTNSVGTNDTKGSDSDKTSRKTCTRLNTYENYFSFSVSFIFSYKVYTKPGDVTNCLDNGGR